MSTERRSFLAFLWSIPVSAWAAASGATARLVDGYWPAFWITCPQASPRSVGVCLMRKQFLLNSTPSRFIVYVSADNRYKLYVNGKVISRGPSRGDADHWRFETVNIAPELHRGVNTLAAAIWNYADLAPMAQITNETGFLVQGESKNEAVVNTNASWGTFFDLSRKLIPMSNDQVAGYYVAGLGESLDGTIHPWGWETADRDVWKWEPARELGTAGPRGMQDSHSPWMLVPDSLPPQSEALQRFRRVAREDGLSVPAAFLNGNQPFIVPAHSTASALLDQTFETTAYPELVVSGGKGSRVRLTYAEALVAPDGTKGNRNEIQGKTIHGVRDEFLPDGGERRAFTPFWWRAYRYVQMDIQTADADLTVEDIRGYFTAYPFHLAATFECNDPSLEEIWKVGWRTAQLCAHETYMDCPYYEQLQYVGDTRIQALISLYATGDDRLVKNAIKLIADSQTSEGLTQSRYPSRLPQYIPGFSLYWIGMMRDLWWYRGEAAMLRPLLENARAVLAWYKRHLSSSGLLGRLPWWPFLDWAAEFEDGVPPQEKDGQSSSLTLQYAVALLEMAGLEGSFGDVEQAQRNRERAQEIGRAVYRSCWDPAKRLLADTPAKRSFSQQANILGILADAIPRAEEKAVLARVLGDPALTQTTYYFKFYLFRAMKKAGLADQYLAQLGPWRTMLAEGLSTFAETPGNPRSDCHAWSAHPVFDLLATVAGVVPSEPGFARVAIEPHLGELRSLRASVPHRLGPITVSYDRQRERLRAEIDLPTGLTGAFQWRGHRVMLHSGRQEVNLLTAEAALS